VQYSYLILMIVALLGPLSMSFEKNINFISKIYPTLFTLIISSILFIVWDMYYTQLGVWSFNFKYIIDYKLYNLPIEEVMFFWVVPYACLFIYENVKKFINSNIYKTIGYIFFILISALTLLIFFGIDFKLYTHIAFILSLGFSIIYILRNKISKYGRLVVTFLFCLIPFLIVNGILTAYPIVVYNSNEILGSRFYSIPIEDFVYLKLMLLVNISIYDEFVK